MTCLLGFVAIALLLAHAVPTAAGHVRVPRDSPVVVHGQVQRSGLPAMSTGTAPGKTSQIPKASLSCNPKIFPDPGYRPMWVPETTCWTGFETIRVPGHWQE